VFLLSSWTSPFRGVCHGHHLGTYGRRTFAVAGPPAWNSLPDPVRNPNATEAAFRRLLKAFPFAQY